MAGPVQETSPQQQAAKRSAEADPEPSPGTKRPAEDSKPKLQEHPLNATAASEHQLPVCVSLHLSLFQFRLLCPSSSNGTSIGWK